METEDVSDGKQASASKVRYTGHVSQPFVHIEDDNLRGHFTSGPKQGSASDLGPDPSLIEDLPNMMLLIVLYMMQGVPLGLTMGAMPLLLASKASYTQVNIIRVIISNFSWPCTHSTMALSWVTSYLDSVPC
jgi:hypothetical protein